LRQIKARRLIASHENLIVPELTGMFVHNSADRGKRPIVLVDDDPALVAALEFSFETDGFCVAGFASAEALLAGAPAACACLVIDQNLPGMSGVDLIESLWADGRRAPAILITTHPSVQLRARAARLGVEVVEKPLMGDALIWRVRRIASVRS
jgi:FixJ family two-component response regulator